jgi:hypothetical protein
MDLSQLPMQTRKLAWLFFLALTLFYYSLSPGYLSNQGYIGENLTAAGQIVSHVAKWLTLRSDAPPVAWPLRARC